MSILTKEPAARPERHAAGARTAGRMESKLAPVGYTVAALFILVPLLDIATLGLPLRFGDTAWRFGVLGAASNYLLTCCFGLAAACWTAAHFQHRLALRLCAGLTALFALVLIVAGGDFALDAIQLRRQVPAADAQAFLVGSTKALIKYVLIAGASILVALVAWRAGRARTR